MADYIHFFRSNDKFRDMQVSFCGYEECVSGHSYGPAVRDFWLFHIILSGKGIFTVDQQTYHLHAGDGFLIEPGTQIFYEADKDSPWTYCWLGVKGNLCTELMKDLGLGGDVLTFSTSSAAGLRDIILKMLSYRKDDTVGQYMVQGLAYQFFSVLLQDMEVQIVDVTSRNEIVNRAVEYVRDNYANPSVKVTEIARAVNVERGYLYSLFMKHLGLSPQEYLKSFRLTKATELLDHTDFPMGKVALYCGYQDPVTFSKAFKKMFGLPPAKYRFRSLENMVKSGELFGRKADKKGGESLTDRQEDGENRQAGIDENDDWNH